jgi:hypothetical protein
MPDQSDSLRALVKTFIDALNDEASSWSHDDACDALANLLDAAIAAAVARVEADRVAEFAEAGRCYLCGRTPTHVIPPCGGDEYHYYICRDDCPKESTWGLSEPEARLAWNRANAPDTPGAIDSHCTGGPDSP